VVDGVGVGVAVGAGEGDETGPASGTLVVISSDPPEDQLEVTARVEKTAARLKINAGIFISPDRLRGSLRLSDFLTELQNFQNLPEG